jgi:hypothetical protein
MSIGESGIVEMAVMGQSLRELIVDYRTAVEKLINRAGNRVHIPPSAPNPTERFRVKL